MPLTLALSLKGRRDFLLMQSIDEFLAAYDYALPPELIAQEPASPRDSARLLVSDPKNDIEEISTVRHLADFLPRPCVLVLNDTKVIPSRITLKKKTGGHVDALFTTFHGNPLKALLNRTVTIGDTLTTSGGKQFLVTGREDREWLLKPQFPLSQFSALLAKHGRAPLPPYIKHSPLTLSEQRKKYQTVFASHPGSIAAPTASLHFTERLLKELKKKGVTIVRVTLHVHLGTFLPVSEEQLKTGQLHEERYHISKNSVLALKKAKKSGIPIIATGTTALRTLESATDENGNIIRPEGATRLFIRDGYRFRMVDGLLTNFHVPKSSLLMLVSAFFGRSEMMRLYRKAIDAKMRFFSFGDAMLLLPR